ncbi:hypothetical protein JCM3770_007221 [Rhodotorula araucariae]
MSQLPLGEAARTVKATDGNDAGSSRPTEPTQDESSQSAGAWEWRETRGNGLLHWGHLRRYRYFLREHLNDDEFSQRLHLDRLLHWLPDGVPPLKTYEVRNSAKHRFLAIDDVDLGRLEDDLVARGQLRPSQLAHAWKQSGARLHPARGATRVVIEDEAAFRALVDAMARENAMVTKPTLRTTSASTVDPSAASPSGAVDASPAPAIKGDSAVRSSAAAAVSSDDLHVENISSEERKQAELTSGSPEKAARHVVPKELVDWEGIVSACEGFTKAHERSQAQPAIQALLPLTPAKLFEGLDAEVCGVVFHAGGTDGAGQLYVKYGLVKRALRRLKQMGAFAGAKSSFRFRVNVTRSTILEGAKFSILASLDDLFAAGEYAQAGQRSLEPMAGENPATVAKLAHKLSKKRLAAAAESLPTPAPSVEATPEPRAKKVRVDDAPSPAPQGVTPPPSPTVAPGSTPPRTNSAEPAFFSGDLKRTYQDLVAEAKEHGLKHFELETLRLSYTHAQRHGGAAFVALDVEFWERSQDFLLEFGWSSVEFVAHPETGKVEARRDDQHVVVKENRSKRNGRFAPDARDHFDFGRTIHLPQRTIYHTLAALLDSLSAHQHVFLIFHDPRADLRCLGQIGFDADRYFHSDLRDLGASPQGSEKVTEGKVWVVDTQRLFSAWINRKAQIGLEKACTEVKVPTKRLHNAGNDAHYTLDLFERLMNRKRAVAPGSPLVLEVDARFKAEAKRRARQSKEKAQRLAEKQEQKELAHT